MYLRAKRVKVMEINDIKNLPLLIETSQLLMTTGVEIISRAGVELVKSIRDTETDSSIQFQMILTESECCTVTKIITNILTVLPTKNPEILKICASNINSLGTIVTASVNLKKTDMPQSLRSKIDYFKKECINNNNKELWEKLQGFIYSIYNS